MKAFFKTFLLLIFMILIMATLILGYFGFIPGVSKVFGSEKPRDLDIKSSQQNYTDFMQKAQVQWVELASGDTPEQSIEFSGIQEKNVSFSQEECSARLNFAQWKYLPVSDTQVKINNDGTVEFSGTLITSRLNDFAQAIGYSGEEVKEVLRTVTLLRNNPAIYFKVKPTVTDNVLTVHTEKIEIGRFVFPLNRFDSDGEITRLAGTIFKKIPNFYAKSVIFNNGQMYFQGTTPIEIRAKIK